MKVFGNSKNSRHSKGGSHAKGAQRRQAEERPRRIEPIDERTRYAVPAEEELELYEDAVKKERRRYEEAEKSSNRGGELVKEKNKGSGTLLRLVIIVLALILAIAGGLVIYYKTQVKPPDVTQIKRPGHTDEPLVNLLMPANPFSRSGDAPVAPIGPTEPVDDPSGGPDATRVGQKYTFVAVGQDATSGNTDTIMICTFDTTDYSLAIVSIPRDTLVNVSWNTKKANSIYALSGVKGLRKSTADLIGYEPDFYGVINLDAFIKLVDAIGGITFDVPFDMNYDDPVQDLHIHVNKGEQVLNGYDAMGVWRFRKNNNHTGYSNGDIGRLETQHAFLMSAAKQLLDNASKIPITTIADIFINNVETDLTVANCIWFAKELLKMDLENVHVMTIPTNYTDKVYGTSYPTIRVNEWLAMLNEYFNPFDQPMVAKDLSILTRGNGVIYSTDGHYAGRQSWGNDADANKTNNKNDDNDSETPITTPDDPNKKPESKPDPTPDPTPGTDPTPTPDPEPAPTPEPTPAPADPNGE